MSTSFAINLRGVTYSLSNALDLVGIDDTRHGKRVAFMAAACSRVMGWPEDVFDRLVHASMLHDCGVSSSIMHQRLIEELHWPGEREHCIRGHEMLSSCPPLANLSVIVKHHHTHWTELLEEDIDEIEAAIANCIFLVDRVDALMACCDPHDPVNARARTTERIKQLSGEFFMPELVEAFVDASQSEAFWLTMMDDRLDDYLRGWLARGHDRTMSSDELRSVAGVFADIVDAKSPYTAEHSRGVASLARHIGTGLGLAPIQCDKLEIAGLLHDLGKLRVPDEVLDKNGPLDERERAIMARHSYDTYLILSGIDGLEETARWAAQHHETPNGRGYPFHNSGEDLSLEARILAVADVFQALAQHRPYRDALPASEIMSILLTMSGAEQLDADVVEFARCHLHACYAAATPTRPSRPDGEHPANIEPPATPVDGGE